VSGQVEAGGDDFGATGFEIKVRRGGEFSLPWLVGVVVDGGLRGDAAGTRLGWSRGQSTPDCAGADFTTRTDFQRRVSAASDRSGAIRPRPPVITDRRRLVFIKGDNMRRALLAIGLALLTSVATVTSAVPAIAAESQFFAAGAVQNATASNGAFGTFTVNKPFVASTDFFSEMSVVVGSATGNDSVEVGWRVDRALNGDDQPHLFVGSAVKGSIKCPNACGFEQVDPNVRVGMALEVGSSHRFLIQQFSGVWWIGDNSTWFGFFRNSVWGGAFTQAGSVLFRGEVFVGTSMPCTDMGSGVWPLSPTSGAASITDIGYFNGPAVHVSAFEQRRAFYAAALLNNNGVQVGGAGECNNPI
jgi:hypothetical protein